MEIWSRFCRVPRFFWCFDFFSEYLQKSLYISIFLYPKGDPLKTHSMYGIRERAHNMERCFRGSPLEYGNAYGDMEPVLQGSQVFWCFDFFSEYLQKSLYISIFLYPRGEPLKPRSIYGTHP